MYEIHEYNPELWHHFLHLMLLQFGKKTKHFLRSKLKGFVNKFIYNKSTKRNWLS